jgi:hypothetical protein
VYDRMRVTQTRPQFNIPSERREHHQPQVIGRLIREKISDDDDDDDNGDDDDNPLV